ncbi:MAG TPA: hypothetical protein VHZ03_43565 [Trebonia sp.]|nr:hypothetical protein [Trebonia sp.]
MPVMTQVIVLNSCSSSGNVFPSGAASRERHAESLACARVIASRVAPAPGPAWSP